MLVGRLLQPETRYTGRIHTTFAKYHGVQLERERDWEQQTTVVGGERGPSCPPVQCVVVSGSVVYI